MHWYTDPKIVTTIGLSCDILGAFLVAIEVVRIFRGPTVVDSSELKKKEDSTIKGVHRFGGVPDLEESPEYAEHKKETRYYMAIGLVFLVFGFLLQIAALWL